MYETNDDKKTFTTKKKLNIVALVLILLSIVTIKGTFAILFDDTDAVINSFERANMSCTIEETFNGEIKTDVSIKNTSTEDNISGYIRAMIVVYWQDKNGNIHAIKPIEGTDYVMKMGTGWKIDDDGYYYWPEPVAAGDNTGILIDYCYPNDGAEPDGYVLVVDVFTEIVQSNPTSAVSEAWGYIPGEVN